MRSDAVLQIPSLSKDLMMHGNKNSYSNNIGLHMLAYDGNRCSFIQRQVAT